MKKSKSIDIVIPVLNEAESLPFLLSRINDSLKRDDIKYGVIIIDDHSTDNTLEVVKKLSKKYPVIYKEKSGKKGKAYSILEGVGYSKSEYIAMIDGDLQYPPESIPEMYNLAIKNDLGMVVANRVKHKEGFIRRIGSKVIRFLVGKMIMGLKVDVQSGLKLFKREIIEHLDERNIKSWSLDIPLIHTVSELGLKVDSIDINFESRVYGKTKFDLKTSINGIGQVLFGALKLKLTSRKVFYLKPAKTNSMLGAGIVYKRKSFLTHTTLHHSNSALVTFTRKQKLAIYSLISLFLIGLAISTQSTLILFVAILSALYFADVFFNLYLVLKSLHFPPELIFNDDEIRSMDESKLPLYTILCPLYHEAGVLPQFIESIKNIDYPKNKLEVLLLLEEDDEKTIESARKLKLPSFYKILIVPHSFPKTKPKACNYGLSHSKGEFVVIYDAEDIPDPLQLKKAILGFKKLGSNYSCLQAKLNYHNPNQNLLTRFFTSEYSLWFDIMLPALQTINTTIPLGGTSNHFRREDLNKFEGWDPFNVTEDADLGIRLFKAGGKTAIIDSITLEEANSNLKNWIRQRSRWIKGYLQTYLVHMRNPLSFAKDHGRHWFVFQLVSGLRISFMIINPVLWGLTLSYFLLYKFVGPQIESLYPSVVFYMAITSAVFGNFLYIYYYMIGTAKHGQYQLIKYIFLIPLYWIFASISAFIAFWQLLVKPHYWEKTIHGLTKAEKEKMLFKFEFAGLRDFGINRINIIKRFSKSSLAGGAFLIFASMLANVMNFIYNAYLGKTLDLNDFGLISLVGSFVFLFQVPISAISSTATYRSAYLFGKYSTAVRTFWSTFRKKTFKLSVLISLIWIVLTPLLMNIFKTNEYLPFLIFVPILLMSFAGSIDWGYLSGNMRFQIIGVMAIIESVTKLALSVLIVSLDLDKLVYLSLPISILFSFIVGWFYANRLKQTKDVDIEISTYFPKRFFASSVLAKISTVSFLSLDLILAKVYLSPQDAGLYALLSLAGKMIYLFGGQFSQFILPVVSKNEGEGKDSNRTFYKLFFATTAICFLGFLGMGVFGYLTMPFLFGDKVLPIVIYLPLFTFTMILQVLSQSIINFHQSKDAHVFPVVNFLLSLITILGIYIFHSNIGSIVNVMFVSALISFIAMGLMHFFSEKVHIVVGNIIDFAGIFKKIPSVTSSDRPEKLKILIFNWRDKRHVWSGGAEVYTHEIAKRWVRKGHLVTLFCGNDTRSPRNEVIDGVQMVRRGGFYTVYLWAFLYYVFRFRGKYDVVIDNENGIPFFTPLYVKEAVVGLIHHVHQEVILNQLKLPKYLLPIAFVAKQLEGFLMPIVYKNVQMITVSESTKIDMEKLGFGKKVPIKIVNPGVDLLNFKPSPKSERPSLLYLGRVKAYKSIDTLIRAVAILVKDIPQIQINIVGDGENRDYLERLSKKLGLEKHIYFWGKVTDEEKVSLFGSSWVFVYPSTFEGWGISVIEANACGTPVVASDVAGLRDSVKNLSTGFLVKPKDVDAFAEKINILLTDDKLREKFSKDSIKWAQKFDWDRSAEIFMHEIYEYLFNTEVNNLNAGDLKVSLN